MCVWCIALFYLSIHTVVHFQHKIYLKLFDIYMFIREKKLEVITFFPINYWSLSTCHHELTHQPKESMKLPFSYRYPHSIRKSR
jgi:hypothetical protein